jgi:hypothetical protein
MDYNTLLIVAGVIVGLSIIAAIVMPIYFEWDHQRRLDKVTPVSTYKVTQKVEGGIETLEYGVFKDGSKRLLRSSFTGTVGKQKEATDFGAEDYM